MTIKYFPDQGISVNGTFVRWETKREDVRKLLKSEFTTGDIEFEGVQYGRDIYNVLFNEKAFCFFNYDANQNLRDLELHEGLIIELNGRQLPIGGDFESALLSLSNVTARRISIGDGEVLFPDLKLCVSNGFAMGSENEDEFTYAYLSSNIDHLLKASDDLTSNNEHKGLDKT